MTLMIFIAFLFVLCWLTAVVSSTYGIWLRFHMNKYLNRHHSRKPSIPTIIFPFAMEADWSLMAMKLTFRAVISFGSSDACKKMLDHRYQINRRELKNLNDSEIDKRLQVLTKTHLIGFRAALIGIGSIFTFLLGIMLFGRYMTWY